MFWAALHSRYDRGIVRAGRAIAGALMPIDEAQDAIASSEAAAHTLAARLDARSDETERGWAGRLENGGYVLTREVRGVIQAAILDAGLLASVEARRLSEHTASLAEVFAKPAVLVRKDEHQVSGPGELLDARHGGWRQGDFTDAALQGAGRDEPGPALGGQRSIVMRARSSR